jgi:hypothetical protein
MTNRVLSAVLVCGVAQVTVSAADQQRHSDFHSIDTCFRIDAPSVESAQSGETATSSIMSNDELASGGLPASAAQIHRKESRKKRILKIIVGVASTIGLITLVTALSIPDT